MRKFLILFAFLALVASCSKDKDNDTENQLPAWLQERIAADEKESAANPQSGLDLGAWLQYSYKDSVYFEYHNLLMSSLPKVYQYDGTEVNFMPVEYADYQKGKCCKKFVWKGKSYFED